MVATVYFLLFWELISCTPNNGTINNCITPNNGIVSSFARTDSFVLPHVTLLHTETYHKGTEKDHTSNASGLSLFVFKRRVRARE